MWPFRKPATLPTPDQALPGRAEPMRVPAAHHVNGRPLTPPYPAGLDVAEFALGCFWGEEQLFWRLPGVWVTAVGYEGGSTPNPTYEEVCTGRTGHAETVRVVFDPVVVPYERLLATFWEAHDPTQGMRQGNDVGTQYRSVIFVHTDAQRRAAEASRDAFQERLTGAGYGPITTEIRDASDFYFAEGYHQQYLAKNSPGFAITGEIAAGLYCPNHATGVTLPNDWYQSERLGQRPVVRVTPPSS